MRAGLRRSVPIGVLVACAALATAPALADRTTAQAGSYAGEFTSAGNEFGEVEFKVKKDGRKITGFAGVVIATCYDSGQPSPQVEPVPFSLGKVAVSANGSFEKSLTEEAGQFDLVYELSGKLKRRGVASGRLVANERCEADERFRAELR